MLSTGQEIIFSQNFASQALLWQREEILPLAFKEQDFLPILFLIQAGFEVLLSLQQEKSPSLKQTILDQLSFLERCLDDAAKTLKQSKFHDLPPDITPLASNLDVISKNSGQIIKALNSLNSGPLDEQKKELKKALLSLREAAIYLTWVKATGTPTKDKHLNVFITITMAFQNQMCNETFFELAWVVFSNYLRWSRRNFKRLLEIAKSLTDISCNLDSYSVLYQNSKIILETLKSITANKAYSEIPQHFQPIKSFFDGYDELRQILSKRFETLGSAKKSCLKCHHQNHMEAWSCKLCGFIFPELAAFTQNALGDSVLWLANSSVNAYYLEVIINAADDFKDNEISQEEFFSVLGWFHEVIQILRTNLSENQGIKQLEAALAYLTMWVSTRSQSDLNEGISFLVNGNKDIDEVIMSLNNTPDIASLKVEESNWNNFGAA